MRCPADGDLRSLLTEGSGGAAMRGHVASCAVCAARSDEIRSAVTAAERALSLLGSGSQPDPVGALNRFKAKTERKPEMSEFGKRKLRPAFALGGVAVVLMALLLISPVRSAALGLLNVFRVEKFAAITIDVSKLPVQLRESLQEGMHEGPAGVEQRDPNAFGVYQGPLKPERGEEVGSLGAAEKKVGGKLANAGDSLGSYKQTEVYVTQPETASYTFDTAKIRAKLDERGLTSIRVPKQIDGKTFTVNIPRGVAVRYGSGKESVVFAQGPSPSLTIPEGVDMNYLRQDFLMVPGLPADFQAQLKEIEDWEHTLVIPIPPGGSSKEVKIEGADGLLISDKLGEHNGVLWQQDGKLYALGGKLTSAEALAAARAVDMP